jgi:hypothetical protein
LIVAVDFEPFKKNELQSSSFFLPVTPPILCRNKKFSPILGWQLGAPTFQVLLQALGCDFLLVLGPVFVRQIPVWLRRQIQKNRLVA